VRGLLSSNCMPASPGFLISRVYLEFFLKKGGMMGVWESLTFPHGHGDRQVATDIARTAAVRWKLKIADVMLLVHKFARNTSQTRLSTGTNLPAIVHVWRPQLLTTKCGLLSDTVSPSSLLPFPDLCSYTSLECCGVWCRCGPQPA
jgi:hypothetical protein